MSVFIQVRLSSASVFLFCDSMLKGTSVIIFMARILVSETSFLKREYSKVFFLFFFHLALIYFSCGVNHFKQMPSKVFEMRRYLGLRISVRQHRLRSRFVLSQCAAYQFYSVYCVVIFEEVA